MKMRILLNLCFGLLSVSLGAHSLLAEITFFKEYRGQQIACSVSGLRGFSSSCGLENGASLIFVGTILSSIETSLTGRELRVRPEEIFLGTPDETVEIVTDSAGCIEDELRAGDKWLFSLYKESTGGKYRLYYGNASGPVEKVPKQIEFMRKSANLVEAGFVQGNVVKSATHNVGSLDSSFPQNSQSLEGHTVILTSDADQKQYSAETDSKGHYRFEPLPVGKYRISANTLKAYWAEDGPVKINPHGCVEVDFNLMPEGRISGRITDSKGDPAKILEVTVISLASKKEAIETVWTDQSGFYIFHNLPKGRYLVGIHLDDYSIEHQKQKVFFPGAISRAQAAEIEIDSSGEHKSRYSGSCSGEIEEP